MGKKVKSAQISKTASPIVSAAASEPRFPEISCKDVACRVLLEDQIILVDNLLSPEECKAFVRFIDNLPLELTPPPKKGEAQRVNHRISITAPNFAGQLFEVLAPYLPSFPYPPMTARRHNEETKRTIHSLNSNIRLYKYTVGQYFGPHYDDSVRDSLTGAKSEWTLLIYLTGTQDGVKGGETLFYQDQKGQPRKTITPPLTRGMALLHRHGNECLLHEGSEILSGTKYVLRSDLMFLN